MSAWLVSKQHIDVMVTASIALGITAKDDANETGEMLWQENCFSLMARYGDRYEMDGGTLPNPGEYVVAGFEPAATENLVFVAKQVNCYAYQSCEHQGWPGSKSVGIVDKMLNAIALKLGTRDISSLPAYDIEPWGVDA